MRAKYRRRCGNFLGFVGCLIIVVIVCVGWYGLTQYDEQKRNEAPDRIAVVTLSSGATVSIIATRHYEGGRGTWGSGNPALSIYRGSELVQKFAPGSWASIHYERTEQ